MNVGELREALEGLPEDWDVSLEWEEHGWGGMPYLSDVYLGTVRVGANEIEGATLSMLVHGEQPPRQKHCPCGHLWREHWKSGCQLCECERDREGELP